MGKIGKIEEPLVSTWDEQNSMFEDNMESASIQQRLFKV